MSASEEFVGAEVTDKLGSGMYAHRIVPKAGTCQSPNRVIQAVVSR